MKLLIALLLTLAVIGAGAGEDIRITEIYVPLNREPAMNTTMPYFTNDLMLGANVNAVAVTTTNTHIPGDVTLLMGDNAGDTNPPPLAGDVTADIIGKYHFGKNPAIAFDITNLIESVESKGQLVELIKTLAESGKICDVIGHQWRGGRPGEGMSKDGGWGVRYADYHPNTLYRTCIICGKCEAQTINDWE